VPERLTTEQFRERDERVGAFQEAAVAYGRAAYDETYRTPKSAQKQAYYDLGVAKSELLVFINELVEQVTKAARIGYVDHATMGSQINAAVMAAHNDTDKAVREAVEQEREAIHERLRVMNVQGVTDVLTSRDRGYNAALNHLGIWLDRRSTPSHAGREE